MAAAQEFRYCIVSARCGLCRDEIDDGEVVVVARHADDVSAEFTLRKKTGLAEGIEYNRTPVCMCCGLCDPDQDSPGPTGAVPYSQEVPCYHVKCFRFGLSVLSPAYLASTAYKFEPTSSEDRRRENALRSSAAGAGGLPQLFPLQHLPPELWLKIARLVVREWAIAAVPRAVLSVGHFLVDHIGGRVELDLSRDVYASYASFEGVRYVQSLRNVTRVEAGITGEHLILDAAKSPSIHSIYLAFDHLGIRQVVFVSPNRVLSAPDSAPGLWWRRLSRQEGISKIEVTADGVKLRNIVDVSSDLSSTSFHTELDRHIAWPVRDPGSVTLVGDTDILPPQDGEHTSRSRLHVVGKKLGHPRGLRMTRLECNFPGIEGYSAASHQDRVFMIHAHRKGSVGPEYDWLDKHTPCHWIYMPINAGEYVARVWLSPKRLTSYNKTRGLMFVTNRRNRTSFVHWRPKKIARDNHNHFTHPYDRVHKLAEKGTVIYFSAFDPTKPSAEDHAQFAFENAAPYCRAGKQPKSALAVSEPMAVEDPTDRYFSSCRLENIVEVIPCRSPPGQQYAEGAVIGMLVRYANGDRACVGAFRFDWAAGDGLCIRTLYLGCGLGRVMDVRNHLPPGDDGLSWTEIPLEGKLEWWFSYDAAEVHHITEGLD